MATVKGMLGQSAPIAATLTDMYTVPALKNSTGRAIITNRSSTATKFRVSVAVAGAVDEVKQYISYDKDIAGQETGSTIAIILGAGDVLRVYATLATLSFCFTGIEQDN